MTFSLNARTFIPIANSSDGVVDKRTEFHFTQTGKSFRADYTGGDIRIGHLIGHFTDTETGQMLYHCETLEGELKAGRADAVFKLHPNGRITMSLDWAWVSGAQGSGKSKYIELIEASQ